MGEGDVFKSTNSKTTTDSGDTNWDINDPDIPARIDQYVSIKIQDGHYVSVKMVIIIEGITGPALTPVLSVIV